MSKFKVGDIVKYKDVGYFGVVRQTYSVNNKNTINVDLLTHGSGFWTAINEEGFEKADVVEVANWHRAEFQILEDRLWEKEEEMKQYEELKPIYTHLRKLLWLIKKRDWED